ncbi:MAG: CNNM domain-containing protein [Holosporales bacterium]|nr:CNNM domain-containing protein [Holosporales bacterium]
MIVSILTILVLLIAAACFSSYETAISIASKAKLHHLAKNGTKKAILAKNLKDQLGYVINTLLACNTAFNAIATSLAANIFLDLFGNGGVVYASALMTCLILVYAEVLPKLFAINNAEKIVIKAAYIMNLVLMLWKPAAKFIVWITKGMLRIFGINVNESSSYDVSVEELRGIIDLHNGPDLDSHQEKSMLKSILDLRSVQVSEIMIHRKNVTMLNADDSIDSIVDQVLDSPFSRLPLWQGTLDNIIGTINVKVLVRDIRSPSKLKNVDIKEIAHKPWFIPDNTDLLEQLQLFRKRREHFALVVDEYGAWLGIVTLEDILEEIVGEIDDEHDISIRGMRLQPDKSVIVDGTVTIRDLNREFDWDLPDESAATIAGLLINSVRMIPDVGQVFMLYGFRLTVLKRQRNQITLIRIAKCDDLRVGE